jgi:hypothetical protein
MNTDISGAYDRLKYIKPFKHGSELRDTGRHAAGILSRQDLRHLVAAMVD